MKIFVSLDKQSKRQQREFNSRKRSTWNGVNPVTKVVPGRTGYDRNKMKNRERRDDLYNW